MTRIASGRLLGPFSAGFEAIHASRAESWEGNSVTWIDVAFVAGRPLFRVRTIASSIIFPYLKSEPRGRCNFPPGSDPSQEE